MAKAKTRRQSIVDLAVLTPLDWVDERTAAVRGTKWFLFRNVPRDISWAQTLGFATLVAFGVQTLTGAILAMYYKPSSEIDPVTGKPIAYASIEHITNEVTLGWLVRGMHRWGASVFVILLFLHMGRVFLFGAYKYPRELQWITGVLLLVTGMLMGFTGYLLPWDQTAYWATVVGINLNGTAPFAGPWLAQFLASGPEITSDALPKWYALHMLLLPGAVIALIGVHIYLVTRLGVTSPPWSREAAGRERAAAPPAGARSGLVRRSEGGD
ncbi:MAG TPA: cytochrome b N-terminal domain-containing protein [Gaiellaceae bacterium]|nr:cytochrome b N-terminal domain-containing protein [Gaiellaceae bacterium]